MSAVVRYPREPGEDIAWGKCFPFILLHFTPLACFYFGFGWREALWCVGLYYARMFFITGAYHRYFSHRAYKTSRWFQFLLAFGGGTAAQKGALWWAHHHRHHHKFSDQPQDIHSPRKGFWWSHVGWILCTKYDETDYSKIKDLAKYPELRFLNRYHWIPPIALGVAVFLIGGWKLLFGGFFLSTVLLYHGTFTINSFTHIWGRTRYRTGEDSRNSLLFALITCGEGWHNNHHYYQSTANMGFYWWEVDFSYYVLKVFSWFGLVWELRKPPQRILEEGRRSQGALAQGALPGEAYAERDSEPAPAE